MSTRKIILATKNPGKVRELADLLAQHGYAVELLPEDCPEAEESGCTFMENAVQKAVFYAKLLGLPSLADDSGLEVDILGGSPGVRSARYADDLEPLPGESRDQRNIRKLLSGLAAHPAPYLARFRCAMALYFDPQQILKSEGSWEGQITLAPSGENGFGYDPVFVEFLSGQTAACLSLKEKFARSHRGLALAGLLAQLGVGAR